MRAQAAGVKMEPVLLTEVPSSLKRLARMVARGFYSIEQVIIIDMLVRNLSMKEDDLADLLKFEKKQLRSCIAQLKNDKFIKTKLRMETGPDGKATRQNYYFINYKVFVNVVKYKLDHMRRKIETEERDSTSRASFKCPQCLKSFTDYEVHELFRASTSEFRCTYCNELVEEDESSIPRTDSRLLLARFNEQIESMFNLLREVEDIKLAPSVLEPDPEDFSSLKKELKQQTNPGLRPDRPGFWSGEATRNIDYNFGQDITINFGEEGQDAGPQQAKKERPIWMVESTVKAQTKVLDMPINPASSILREDEGNTASRDADQDIMQVLLAHEKKSGSGAATAPIIPKANSDNESETSESDDETNKQPTITTMETEVGEMEDEEDEEDEPFVTVGNLQVPLFNVTDDLISKMTPAEKENYIKLSQDVYAKMYE